MKSVAMDPPVADVDDTAAFMAAARSFKLEKEYGKPPAVTDDASTEQEGSRAAFEATEGTDVPTTYTPDEPMGTLVL